MQRTWWRISLWSKKDLKAISSLNSTSEQIVYFDEANWEIGGREIKVFPLRFVHLHLFTPKLSHWQSLSSYLLLVNRKYFEVCLHNMSYMGRWHNLVITINLHPGFFLIFRDYLCFQKTDLPISLHRIQILGMLVMKQDYQVSPYLAQHLPTLPMSWHVFVLCWCLSSPSLELAETKSSHLVLVWLAELCIAVKNYFD